MRDNRFIRLKTNLREHCVQDRLQYDPDIVELHLELHDLLEERKLRSTIRMLQNKGIRVYLHQPSRREGVYLDILTADEPLFDAYMDTARRLDRVCREEQVRCVIHAHYHVPKGAAQHALTKGNSRVLRERIERVLAFAADRFLWEDSTAGLFSCENPYLLSDIVKPLRLPLNVDVSHAFIALRGDNALLRDILTATKPYAQYYHLVDSMGQKHDSLQLGQGRIDWEMVAPFVIDRDFIFEIALAGDHSDCTPMIESAAYFRKIAAAIGPAKKE
jgi:sugar phosphate isomerase/epimerase